jgi:hypothetical protein
MGAQLDGLVQPYGKHRRLWHDGDDRHILEIKWEMMPDKRRFRRSWETAGISSTLSCCRGCHTQLDSQGPVFGFIFALRTTPLTQAIPVK